MRTRTLDRIPRRLASAAAIAAGLLAAPAHAQIDAAANLPATGGDSFDALHWSLQVRAYAGYDDNVLLVPDKPPYFDPRADKGSLYGGVSGNLGVRHVSGSGTTVGAAIRADGVYYFGKQRTDLKNFTEQDDARDYSLASLGVTAFLEQDLSFRAKFGASYTFRHEDAKIEAIGLDGHTLSAFLQLRAGRRTTLRASGAVSFDNFYVDFRPTTTRDRDGTFMTFDLGLTHRLAPGHTLSLGLGYVNNDSGFDWDFDGWRANAGLTSRISGPLWLRLGAAYTAAQYRGGFTDIVPAPGRTNEDRWDLSAALLLRLGAHWTADLSASHQGWNANLPQFEGARNRVSAGVTWTM